MDKIEQMYREMYSNDPGLVELYVKQCRLDPLDIEGLKKSLAEIEAYLTK